MHRRLKKLEGKDTSQNDCVTVILREFVKPSENGPKSNGIGVASVVGGKSYRRRDFENDAAFRTAVDAEHKELHGEPVQWDDTEYFTTAETP